MQKQRIVLLMLLVVGGFGFVLLRQKSTENNLLETPDVQSDRTQVQNQETEFKLSPSKEGSIQGQMFVSIHSKIISYSKQPRYTEIDVHHRT